MRKLVKNLREGFIEGKASTGAAPASFSAGVIEGIITAGIVGIPVAIVGGLILSVIKRKDEPSITKWVDSTRLSQYSDIQR